MKHSITGLNGLTSQKHRLILLMVLTVFFSCPPPARPSENNNLSNGTSGNPVLSEATMCEEIKDGLPLSRAVLFSIKHGKVVCFSTFSNIPEQTTIFHKWYFRDKLIYKIKLSLNPPRWSTYSSIKLRDTDRGPWRVEIADQQNNVYQILRFSVAE